MNNSPSPSRLRLDTSLPEGGEEGSVPRRVRALPRPLPGGRWSAKQTGEGETAKRPVRRKPGSTQRARSLRQAGNQAEALLWLELKAKRLGGYHFVRQLPIGPYVADFACRTKRLVVEIDGSQHAENPYDRRRDEFMRSRGYSILRFWSHEVIKHRTAVCEAILAALEGSLAEDVVASDVRFVFAGAANSTPSLEQRDPTQ